MSGKRNGKHHKIPIEEFHRNLVLSHRAQDLLVTARPHDKIMRYCSHKWLGRWPKRELK